MWQHFDDGSCPGQGIGVRTRLENGLSGFIHTRNLSDKHVSAPEERVHVSCHMAVIGLLSCFYKEGTCTGELLRFLPSYIQGTWLGIFSIVVYFYCRICIIFFVFINVLVNNAYPPITHTLDWHGHSLPYSQSEPGEVFCRSDVQVL